LHFRPAELTDTATIARLVSQYSLERFDLVTNTTETQWENALFGANTTAEVILAVLHSVPIGFALFDHSYSTCVGKPGIFLEDMYVNPISEIDTDLISAGLMQHLAHLAIQRNCGRFEWVVRDSDVKHIAFSKLMGAVPMDEWIVFRVQGDALDVLAAKFEALAGLARE
jgi:hypothetical protein